MPRHHTADRRTFAPVMVTLDSGTCLAYDHVPSVDSCAVGIWIKAGTRDEPAGQAGVAHLVEHVSFRRTPERTTRRIAREFENVGAYANAYTTKEETCYYVRTLTDHVPSVLPTLVDVVLNPVFATSDVDKEREIIVEEIRSYEDEPEEYIYDLAETQLFGTHPLGSPIVGTAESVQHISAAQVRAFHAARYHPESMVLTVSGNVDPDRFVELANSLIRRSRRKHSVPVRTRPRTTRPTIQRINHSTQQAHTLLHTKVPGQKASVRSALTLLNVVLGDGMSSRLHMRLREASGLAYNISSQIQLFADVGTLSVYAGTDVTRENRVISTIERELRSLATRGVTMSELKRAKEQARASRIMSLESLSSRMALLGKGILDESVPENPYAMIDEVMEVGLDEINAVASQYCRPDDWHRIILTPTAE